MDQVVEQTLANGVHLLCEVREHAPVVALQWWIRIGAADELPGWIGAAHLHEHMLFKGTKRRQVGQIAQEVEALGGDINAWTSFDETVYHITLEAKHWQAGMDVLADMFQHASFAADALTAEKEVVVEEIARAQDNAQRRLSQAVFRTMYGDHPYGRAILGTEASVRAISQGDLLRFYEQFYVPEQLRVVVVGPVDPKQVAAWLLAHVKPRAKRQAPAGPALQRASRPAIAPRQQWATHLLQEQVEETRLMLAWPGPAFGEPIAAALDVALAILGQGESSRLWHRLRRELGLVYDIGVYPYSPKDGGLLLLSMGLDAKQLTPALTAAHEVLVALQQQGPSVEECAMVQQALLAHQAYVEETMEGRARQLGRYAEHSQGIAAIEAYRSALAQVTPHTVQQLLQTWLSSPPSLFVQTSQETAPKLLEPAAWLAAWQEGSAATPAAKQVAPKAKGDTAAVAQAHQQLELPNGSYLDMLCDGGPLISFRALWPGGQRFEAKEHAGVGQLLARMWAVATKLRSPKVWSDTITRLGGSLYSFAGRHTVGLAATFPAEHAAIGAQLFAEAIAIPAWLPSTLQEELAALLEERKTSMDRAGSYATEQWLAMLMGDHPTGRSLQGNVETLTGLTLEHVQHYFQDWIRKGPMLLAVAGGFASEQVGPILHYALADSLQAGAKPKGDHFSLEQLYPSLPLHAPEQRHGRKLLDKAQTQVRLGAQGTTINHPDRFALDLLCATLNGQSGRLFLDLRDQQSLAYSVGASHLEGIEAGFIALSMATHPDKCAKAVAGLRHHLDRLRLEPISQQELNRAKATLLGEYALGLQRSGTRAMLTAQSRLYFQHPLAWQDYAQHLAPIQADAILAAANKYLRDEQLVEWTLGP